MYGRVTLAIVARANGAINGSMHHRTDDGKAFRTLNIFWMNTAGNAPLSADLALPNRLRGNGARSG